MTRYEFLKSMGFRGAALMAAMTSCVKEEDTYVNALTINPNQASTSTGTTSSTKVISTDALNKITGVKLKIDLTTNTKLKNVGGYLQQSGIVVAQVSSGTYAAVTQTCTHEPKKQIVLNKSEWYCTAHGARFSIDGKGLNSFGKKGLTVYKVATDGKTLVVY
ncbi:MAG: Rieske 2Fe-2S domain-containing protein [Spirosomataceae bacterium]